MKTLKEFTRHKSSVTIVPEIDPVLSVNDMGKKKGKYRNTINTLSHPRLPKPAKKIAVMLKDKLRNG